jgi:hypothetical protein
MLSQPTTAEGVAEAVATEMGREWAGVRAPWISLRLLLLAQYLQL